MKRNIILLCLILLLFYAHIYTQDIYSRLGRNWTIVEIQSKIIDFGCRPEMEYDDYCYIRLENNKYILVNKEQYNSLLKHKGQNLRFICRVYDGLIYELIYFMER